MPFRLDGDVAMRVRMQKLSDETWDALIEGMEEAYQKPELREMKRLVPVDTGELHDSGHYIQPRREGDSIIGGFVFDAPHAMAVHEDLEAFHPRGEAKYMESVLNQSAPYMCMRVWLYAEKKLPK